MKSTREFWRKTDFGCNLYRHVLPSWPCWWWWRRPFFLLQPLCFLLVCFCHLVQPARLTSNGFSFHFHQRPVSRHTVARKLGMTTGLLKKCVPTGSWATFLVKLSNFMQQIGQHKGRKMPRKIEEKLVTTHRSVAILHTILVYIAN